MLINLLYGWIIFLVVFYMGMAIEYAYYRFSLRQKFHLIMEAFTEEDNEDEE